MATKGQSRVVGIGVMQSEYLPPKDDRNPRNAEEQHCHTRLVDWLVDQPIDLRIEQFFAQHPLYSLMDLPEKIKRIKQVYLNEYPNLEGTLDKLFPEEGSQASDLPATTSEYETIEGRRLLKLHKIKERKPQIVRRKKQAVLDATGRLLCEACDFDFAAVYGKLGEGFAECHHRMPLATLDGEVPTQLEDLAIVCSNCHRILHRSQPMLGVEDLRSLILQRRCRRIHAE